ncbi:hypothetical protein AVEN_237516-1, partial [Araneus ventricosus]
PSEQTPLKEACPQDGSWQAQSVPTVRELASAVCAYRTGAGKRSLCPPAEAFSPAKPNMHYIS